MPMNINSVKSLLVIKHGAFGDVIKALGACRVLRQVYSRAEITLLTSHPYKTLCSETGYFDQIITDPRSWNIVTTFLLLQSLARNPYDFVIDFQNSKRTHRYFKIWRMLRGSPWCGTAPKCSYPIDQTLKEKVHVYDRFHTQLTLLGIPVERDAMAPSLEWLSQKASAILPPSKYALLIPGSSPVALKKRWPVESYAKIAIYLENRGITPVILGGKEENSLAQFIQQKCPQAWNMIDQTSLLDIGSLAKEATTIIGNDTGPTYFASAAGNPTIVLWSDYSNPHVHAPRGKHVTILQQDCLADLPVETVIDTLKRF